MTHALAGLLLGTALLAQETAPAGIFKGVVLERDQGESGELAVRAAGNRVFRLHYDGGTYGERDGKRIGIAQLTAGEAVEIVADQGAAPGQRYVRRIRVLDPAPDQARLRPRRLYRTDLYADIFPRGDLTFSGTVIELTGDAFVLRARGKGPTRLLLRDDTRYLSNGGQAASTDLTVNTRVFVRAGKNLDGDLEAYQIVWGEILTPRER